MRYRVLGMRIMILVFIVGFLGGLVLRSGWEDGVVVVIVFFRISSLGRIGRGVFKGRVVEYIKIKMGFG